MNLSLVFSPAPSIVLILLGMRTRSTGGRVLG
jgi:hypothetical protein